MNDRLQGNLTFKLADSTQRDAALTLRARIYEAELGHPGLDSFDDAAAHLVATTSNGEVVAALRLVRPDQRPFDLERYFDLASLLGADRQPSEVSRFCVDPRFRQMRRDQMIHLGILKLTVEYARKQQITDIVTLGLPHLRQLYRVALFRELGQACEHSVWGSAHLMRLDLVNLWEDESLSRHPVGRVLRGPLTPNIVL